MWEPFLPAFFLQRLGKKLSKSSVYENVNFSQVSFGIIEHSHTALVLTFTDVPVDSVPMIASKFWTVLRTVDAGKVDMKRMKNIVERKIRNVASDLEADPHSSLAYDLIGFMLYGNDKKDVRLPNFPGIYASVSLEESHCWGFSRYFNQSSLLTLFVRHWNK